MIKKIGIRIATLLLTLAGSILATILVSSLLHIAADSLFTDGVRLRVTASLISLSGFLVFLLYTGRMIRVITTGDKASLPFALQETAYAAVLLLPLAIVGSLGQITIFEGAAGYVYAPFLSLTALGVPAALSALVYAAVYFLWVWLCRVRAQKKRRAALARKAAEAAEKQEADLPAAKTTAAEDTDKPQ